MNLNLWKQYHIPKIDTLEGRKYVVDGEQFLSVTTLLSMFSDFDVEAWKQRVSEKEADKISKAATSRGTELHEWIESYLYQKEVRTNNPLQIGLRKTIKPLLNRITEVNLLEAPLYSKSMGLAGTVDCVGSFDDIPSIIDFKTSGKSKKKEWIKSYFLQTSIYSYMVEELYSVKIPQVVILIAVENQPAQFFVENRMNWRGDVKDILTKWRKNNGS